MNRQDSVLCKNCHATIPVEIEMDELNEKEDCPSVHVEVECPKCKKKYMATCWFDYVHGSWYEDGITLRGLAE